MTIFFLIIILSSCSEPKKEKKKIETFVYDFEQVLSETEEQEISNLFKVHEKKTTNEIVLVTTSDYGEDKNILFYSVDFGERNGIGKLKKNNGVVIVFSKAFSQVRVSTGYEIESILKDEIAKKMIDTIMIPMFKENDIYNGLYNGSKSIVEFLEKPENKLE